MAACPTCGLDSERLYLKGDMLMDFTAWLMAIANKLDEMNAQPAPNYTAPIPDVPALGVHAGTLVLHPSPRPLIGRVVLPVVDL